MELTKEKRISCVQTKIRAKVPKITRIHRTTTETSLLLFMAIGFQIFLPSPANDSPTGSRLWRRSAPDPYCTHLLADSFITIMLFSNKFSN